MPRAKKIDARTCLPTTVIRITVNRVPCILPIARYGAINSSVEKAIAP